MGLDIDIDLDMDLDIDIDLDIDLGIDSRLKITDSLVLTCYSYEQKDPTFKL